MINYDQIMQDLPVQNFIKSNFKRGEFAYTYKLSTVKCGMYEAFISFPTSKGKLYLVLGNYPVLAYHAECIDDDWSFDLNDINSNADLFLSHIQKNLFSLDYKFCEYLKEVNRHVLKEFFPWKI